MDDNYWERSIRKTLRRRRFLGGSAALTAGAAGLALLGCGGGGDDDNGGGTTPGGQPSVNQSPTPTPVPKEQAVQGGTFRFGAGALLDIWDPHWNASSYTLSPLLAQVYNKLYKWESPISSGKILPDIASALPEQPNDTTVIIKLRKGVKFHNKAPMSGRELTAADVKWNMERQRDATDPKFQRKYQYVGIDKIETPDNYTVKLTMKEPLAPFLSYLAGQWAFMIGREVVEQYGDANREEACIGTGAFIHKEFKPDAYHLQARNPEYFLGPQPYLEQVQSIALADTAASEAAFRTKKIDYTYLGRLPYATVDKIRKDFPNEVRYQKMGNLYFDYYRFTVDSGPFKDARVRQAISAAINRQKINEFIHQGFATLNGAGVPSTLQPWGFTEQKLATYPGYPNASDAAIADARKAMESAGYSDSKRLSVKLPVISPGIIADQAEMEKEDLKKVYIEIEIVPDTFPSLLTKQTKKEMPIWRAQDNGYEDPDEYLYGSFFSTSSRNFFNFNNPDVDALLLKQRRTLDATQRKAVVDELQDKLMKDAPQIGLNSTPAHYLSWNYLKNRKESEWLNMYQAEEVWIDPKDPSASGRPS
ncbi:MAG: ABC transporter substrate-binding protein [Dehalococcoidia bacterium]|nr:ABC transporter substrate-binding protein [Dehalococcoidia bacterium]